MALKAVFIIAAVICAGVLMLSLKAKRRNLGYSLTTCLLIICDILCVFLIEGRPIKEVRGLFFVYYIAFSFMFFGVSWTILKMSSAKNTKPWMAIAGTVSVLMSALVVVFFNVSHVVAFSKKILFGRIWWIVEAAPDASGIMSFSTYCFLCVLSCFLTVALTVYCMGITEKMFKGKYVVIIILQTLLTVFVGITFFLKLPAWIGTLLMNPFSYIVYYYAFMQADIRLRDVAIMSFANEMSDGLILYNRFNDLIHVNDLIRNKMDEEFLESIRDVSELEEWMSHIERVESLETVPYRKGDEEIFFIVRKQNIGSAGHEVGTAYILHDTTNSINQIRLMEKVNIELERTARMKSDFLANMSHELRTPMNAVIGMAQIALREDNVSLRVRDCLNQIDHSGKNLLNIINDILDYSKIDAGKMEIIWDKYEPLSEVNDIANVLQTRIGDKNLEMIVTIDPRLPHELIGDSMRIRQVLINLAGNAVKFTKQGMIRISVDCEDITEDEVWLLFHVIDTGQGIKEEDLEKLFVSFQQVDSKRNRNVEGTGLGLAISKSLCEAMGGTIGVSSEYGKGSDFWFRVPQKISVPEPDLVVEDVENKCIFGIDEREFMKDGFHLEMGRLGIESRVIDDLSGYEPTGKADFIYFEEGAYTQKMEALLEKYPELTAIVLTGQGSDFKPSRKNVRIQRRPISTLTLVLALNDKDIGSIIESPDNNGTIRFTAPEAKILVVDDNSINLSIATGLIEPLGVKCETALSAAEAMEKLEKERFDLILMDHMMPVMDGIEATKAIRENIRSADDTPIVALTANVVEGSREMYLEAGMVDMIAKPVEVTKLYKALFEWLPKDKIIEGEGAFEEENKADSAPVYDCLDCEAAIKALGSEALFKKIVEEYYRRGAKNYDDIVNAYRSKNWPDYAIKTHALKSSSRQIGAPELGDLSQELEMAGKAGDIETIEKYHDTAMDTYKKLLADLSVYFDTQEEAADLTEASEEELRSIFEKLENACVNLDMDEMEECVETLRGYAYPADKKEIVEKMYEAVESMDTDACVEAIREYTL